MGTCQSQSLRRGLGIVPEDSLQGLGRRRMGGGHVDGQQELSRGVRGMVWGFRGAVRACWGCQG